MLRCVYVARELLASPDRLTERALEACRRAEVLVVPTGGRVAGFGDWVDEGGFGIDGEPHDGGLEAHRRARMLAPEECLEIDAADDVYAAVVTRLVERR